METNETVQMTFFDECKAGNVKCKTGVAPSTLHSTLYTLHSSPTMVRVAPGRHAWIPRDKATPPDGYALCRWSQQADGTYAPVPVAGRYVRLNSQVAASLGFVSDGTSDRNRYDTILRLGRAGFIDLVRVAPNTLLLDLGSWYRHLADCMDNPEMWDEGSEDLEIYLKANDLGGWKRNV